MLVRTRLCVCVRSTITIAFDWVFLTFLRRHSVRKTKVRGPQGRRRGSTNAKVVCEDGGRSAEIQVWPKRRGSHGFSIAFWIFELLENVYISPLTHKTLICSKKSTHFPQNCKKFRFSFHNLKKKWKHTESLKTPAHPLPEEEAADSQQAHSQCFYFRFWKMQQKNAKKWKFSKMNKLIKNKWNYL